MNKKKIIIMLIIMFIGGLLIFVNIGKEKAISYIDKKLETDEYSYLSPAAKEYIKELYEETGEVLLTEKNKEKNKPYLNPLYDEYLSVSNEKQSEYDVIPATTRIDYVYNPNASINNEEMPASYDLRNVNGKDLSPVMKNQGDYGLCWAFASVSSIESNMLVNGMTTREDPVIFSTRQVDFATSKPEFLIEKYNPYSKYKVLKDGGNFYYFKDLFLAGISPVEKKEFDDEIEGTWSNYTLSNQELPLKTVLDSSYSNYTVTDTISMPYLDKYASNETKIQWQKKIKKHIMENGSLYVSTVTPSEACSEIIIDDDGRQSFLINQLGNTPMSCYYPGDSFSLHAMSIIGWDDNFKHSYCNSSFKYSSEYSCVKNGFDWIEVEGAWKIQNSWGEDMPYSYGYIAYDSPVNEVSGISGIVEKDWDNNYNSIMSSIDSEYKKNTSFYTFLKNPNVDEALIRFSMDVTFFTKYENVPIKLYIKNNDEFEMLDEIYVNDSGIISVDIQNVNLTEESFTIKAEYDSEKIYIGTGSAYTKNIDSPTKYINANIKNFDNSMTVNIVAKGYETGYKLSLKLYDNQNKLVVNETVSDVYVINELAKFDIYEIKNIISRVEILHNDEVVFSTNLNTVELGTEENPYIINNEEDLANICSSEHNRNSYYKLQKNLYFEYFYDDIKSICENEQEPFKGVLDGDGYKMAFSIKDDASNTGLIKYTDGAVIKNLAIVDSYLEAGSNSGLLIGTAKDTTIDNVGVFGKIKTKTNAGGLIGSAVGQTNISNVYTKIDYITSEVWNDFYPIAASSQNVNINDSYSIANVSSKDINETKRYIYDESKAVEKTLEDLKIKQTYLDFGFDSENKWNISDGLLSSLKKFPNMFLQKIELEKNDIEVNLNDEYFYLYSFISKNISEYLNSGLICYSSDESILTSGDCSSLEMKKEGNVIVTVKTNDGTEMTKQINVTIKDKKISYSDLNVETKIEGENTYLIIDCNLQLKNLTFDEKKVELVVYDESYGKIPNFSSNYEKINDNMYKMVLKKKLSTKDKFNGKHIVQLRYKELIPLSIEFNFDYNGEDKILFEKDDITINLNESYNLYPVIKVNDKNTRLSWSSSDETIVKVDEKGVLYPQKAGTAKVTVVANKLLKKEIIVNVVGSEIEVISVNGKTTCNDMSSKDIIVGDAPSCNYQYDINVLTKNITGDLSVEVIDELGAFGRIGQDVTSEMIIKGLTIVDNKAKILISSSRDGVYTIKISKQNAETKKVVLQLAESYSQYSVKFNSNGGTGEMETLKLDFNTSRYLPKSTIKKQGYEFREWNTKKDGSGISIKDEGLVLNLVELNEKEIELFAIFEKVVNKYNINNNYISKVPLKLSINDYYMNFEQNKNYKYYVFNSKNVKKKNEDLIGTGDKIKIYRNDTLVNEYTNVVLGDVTGTGNSTVADVAKLYQALKGKITMEDCYKEAGNVVSSDSDIKVNDVAKLYQFIKGKIKTLD